jgi:hypothetical protein
MSKPVERLFPFVLRSRILLVGRDTLGRSKSKLQFVLITSDISESSRAQILADFAHYPIVQCYSAEEIEKHFNVRNTKVLGFQKSELARSIYAEMKSLRINKPPREQRGQPEAPKPAESPAMDLPKPCSPENALSAEEQMANFEERLKEDDWGHQPC